MFEEYQECYLHSPDRVLHALAHECVMHTGNAKNKNNTASLDRAILRSEPILLLCNVASTKGSY